MDKDLYVSEALAFYLAHSRQEAAAALESVLVVVETC
jgi:hypothetical protein